MGAAAQILLVGCLLLSGLSGTPLHAGALWQTDRVDVARYREFWLWSGVRIPPSLQAVQTFYLHQGEVIVLRQRAHFQKQGFPVDKLRVPSLWITVRVTTLDMPDNILNRVLDLPRRWAKAGNHVIGLQIDFDAATYRLDDYASFLRRVRHKLDTTFALGVTGLLDWAKTGSVQTLNALPIDELVVQTYQGRRTVSQYERYLPALLQLQRPFKIGLVQDGIWDTHWETRLSASPFYRGEVVFLLNDST